MIVLRKKKNFEDCRDANTRGNVHGVNCANDSTNRELKIIVAISIKPRKQNRRKHKTRTSLAPLIIPCSRSIWMYCSSSAYAKANGTPSRKELVLIIQRALPLNEKLALVRSVMEETVLVTVRRAEGGIMSFRAATRS